MSNINLLGWREELIERQKKAFAKAALVSFVCGAIVVVLTYICLSIAQENQQSRNQVLQEEIAKVDKEIAEIKKLKEYRENLIARMNAIDTLQQNRNIAVHLFSDLPTLVASGVYLNGLKFDNRVVGVKGLAESNPRVSSMLRNIENSKWLGHGAISQTKVEVRDGKKIVPTLPDGLYDFDMSFKVLDSTDSLNNKNNQKGGR